MFLRMLGHTGLNTRVHTNAIFEFFTLFEMSEYGQCEVRVYVGNKQLWLTCVYSVMYNDCLVLFVTARLSSVGN